MPTNIRGKLYKTVAERVADVHAQTDNPLQSIITDLLTYDGEQVVMRATVTFASGAVFTAHARQSFRDSGVAGQSPIEVCETSAVGRALGFAGFGEVDSIASADEVANAQRRQTAASPARPVIRDILALKSELGISDKTLAETLGRDYGATRLEELPDAEAHKLKSRLEAAKVARANPAPSGASA